VAISPSSKNKQLVWEFWQQLSGGNSERLKTEIRSHVHADVSWNGPHPINHLQGREALIADYWEPFLRSFPDLQRRTDVFLGGQFGGHDWVCATGYFTGTFAQDWLDIPATNSKISIRFGEYCKVSTGKIEETYLLLDILDVMRQAGIQLLPPSRGAEGLVPGPATEDGVLLKDQDEIDTEKSLALVDAMIAGLLSYDQVNLTSMNMVDFWHPEMKWYGPGGIGTTYGLKGFEDYHQRPFLEAFPDRRAGDHKARLADGNYVATTGWPSVKATHAGEYLGVAATNKQIGMRVMDLWHREGELLTENWVLIDMIDLFLQFGIDLLDELQRSTRKSASG
jgi:predicted ester cyclase